MSTFDGYFREFDGLIRADNFTKDLKSNYHSKPILYLLSHLHSDHTNGLDSYDQEDCFIYCSSITKESILNTQTLKQRIPINSNEYKFQNLRNKPSVLKALSIKKPFEINLQPTSNPEDDKRCLITLFDANHCPGSVMFLIQISNQSVLYTGDIRAEPWWIESLTKEPILAPFLDFNHSSHFKTHPTHHHQSISLDNIYLDTSGLLYKKHVLTKEQAIRSTLRFMSFYPSDTIFFINTWTSGWEELLERISIHFQTLIHVDPYKSQLYRLPNFKKHYPLLSTSITLDSKSTRFHACERKQRCEECQDERYLNQYEPEKISKERTRFPRVVTVNPMEIDLKKWSRIQPQLEMEIKWAIEQEKSTLSESDPWPTLIISPFTRHSSFKELHKLISIFKPNTLFPNTTQASRGFIEYYLLPTLFQSVLSPGATERLEQEVVDYTEQYSRQIGPLGMVESQVINDLLGSLPTRFSQFRMEPTQLQHEISVDEIFEKFGGFDEQDEVFYETFVGVEEEGKERTILLLKSDEDEDRGLVEKDEDSIRSSSSNGLMLKDFLATEIIDLTKDDHLGSLNRSDQTNHKRSMNGGSTDEENHSKKSKLVHQISIDKNQETRKEMTKDSRALLPSSSVKDSTSDPIKLHPLHISNQINQKLTKLSNEIHELDTKWIKILTDLQLDLKENPKTAYTTLSFQKRMIELIMISKQIIQLESFTLEFIHRIYS